MQFLIRTLTWTVLKLHGLRPVALYGCFLSMPLTHLGPNDAIWHHRTGPTLAKVMACCLPAPSNYLNQYWLFSHKNLSCSSKRLITHFYGVGALTSIWVGGTHPQWLTPKWRHFVSMLKCNAVNTQTQTHTHTLTHTKHTHTHIYMHIHMHT